MTRCFWRPISMVSIALIWASVLCNGKIVKRTSPGKLNATVIQALNVTPLPPLTTRKEKETCFNPILNPDPGLSAVFLYFLDPNPELTTNTNSMESRDQQAAPIRH